MSAPPHTSKPVTDALSRHFGHDTFRPGQQQVIEALLAGRSSLAIFPTGGGKSICYQLPAILLDGLTLVISPLIALMKDQVDMLLSRGISAARLDSTIALPELQRVYQGMNDGSLKLLYVAPERLVSESFVEKLKRTNLAMMAVDEAHCISEWGHNFRPEYLRLSRMATVLKIPRVLALTATATPDVAADICREFKIADTDRLQTPFHRENLHLHITPVREAERLDLLTKRFKTSKLFPAIVYVTLQETAERVGTHLSRMGIRAAAYHAGLADEIRSQVQESFMEGRLDIIVATIAFGMGIDKSDIRAVIHFNLPKTLENYQQETGRAGRDGKSAYCELLACADDLVTLENFTLGDTPTQSALRQLLDHLLRQGETFDISRYQLSRVTDIRPLVLETVITHLEHEEILEPLGAFYSTFQVAFEHSEASILAGHSADRKAFLQAVFSTGKRGWKWLTIDVDAAAESMGEDRDRILKALHWLEESGDIQLKPSGVRHRFRLLNNAATCRPISMAEQLFDLFVRREKSDLKRLQSVVDLAESPDCTTRILLHYFGEELDSDCGHCGRCKSPSNEHISLPKDPVRILDTADISQMQELITENHPSLRGARQLARFLCGMTSPATLRDRLTRHDHFGSLRDLPFENVLDQLESMVTK